MPFTSIKFVWRGIVKVGQRLSQPDVFFYVGLGLMALLVIGTVSQKYIGLYQAQFKYFSCFFFSFYGLPIPGGKSLTGLLLISLILKILFFQKRGKRFIGSAILHGGAVLLLTGGFITGLFSKEFYMPIEEGQSSRILFSYHDVELALLSPSKKTLAVFSEPSLKAHNILKKDLPFELKINKFMKNSTLVKRDQPEGESFVGFAKIFELKNKKREKQNEENQAGLLFQISRGDKTENYALFEDMPIPQTIRWEGKTYTATLRRTRAYLPFSIELIDFQKENYPGTHQASSYQSLIHIVEFSDKKRRLIKMNRPLRYKGWTFYQSSFIEAEKEISVFAVVKNSGRIFPYLSSLIICFGLLIHIPLNTFSKKRK